MPYSSGSELSQLQFRKDRNPPETAVLTFWHVFAAVLLALVVHSVVIGLIVDWRLGRYAAELDKQIAAMMADTPETIIAEPAPRAASAPAAPRRTRAPTLAGPLPALPGTIEARRLGADRACVNGRIYRRLPNGWDHVGGACRATSQ